MAVIDDSARRIYFDANIFIYTVEKHQEYADILTRVFVEIEANSQIVVTSELTLAECLIGARKARSRELEDLYENLLAPSETIKPVPVSREILRAAACYAGDANVKLADAIHVATAIALDCEIFLTNDRRVIAPPPIRLVLLSNVKRA